MAFELIEGTGNRRVYRSETSLVRGYPVKLVRRRGFGSYAVVAPARKPEETDEDYRARDDEEITLEEHDAPDRRRLIDDMNTLEWCGWALRETRSICAEEDEA
jgi:hypothetical protein